MHSGELSGKTSGNTLSDLILGGQDGLVNVLSVILGVAAASHNVKLVIAAAMAATFGESISMAAVAYTSKAAERDRFKSEFEREKREVEEVPEKETQEIREIYQSKGFKGKILDDIVTHITSDKELWLSQMMDEELHLKEVTQKEITTGSFIVGISALVGSFVPITPFFFAPIKDALWISLGVSILILFAAGIYKAKTTVGRPVKSGLQMVIIGMGAAFAGYLIGRLFGSL